jgi:hypothetical protein
MQRYPCNGRLRIWIPKNRREAMIQVPPLQNIRIASGSIAVLFQHKIQHAARGRKPVPERIRSFIKDPLRAKSCRTLREMVELLQEAVAKGDIPEEELKDITDENVRYWWMMVRQELYERDTNPWISTVSYLKELPNVIVHDFTMERRQSICWYFPALFDLDFCKVSEVFIDSTMGTNAEGAELFSIIICEDGYGVPGGYMLMEKKPTDDSITFPGEVTAACTRFFFHAKVLGLSPRHVHTDKASAELAAATVFSSFVCCKQ